MIVLRVETLRPIRRSNLTAKGAARVPSACDPENDAHADWPVHMDPDEANTGPTSFEQVAAARSVYKSMPSQDRQRQQPQQEQ